MSRVSDAVRKANPGKYDKYSDFELEEFVASMDPRYRAAVDKERGVTTTSKSDAFESSRLAVPTEAPAKPPAPSQFEAPQSATSQVAEAGIRGIEGTNAAINNAIVESLPTVGGVVGGTVGTLTGGPLVGAGLAGAGAGTGETLRQFMQRNLPASQGFGKDLGTVGEGAKSVAWEAGKNALLQGAIPAGQAIAKGGMSLALREAPEIVMANPTIAARALQEGVSVTPTGASKAYDLAAKAREAANKLLWRPRTQGAGGKFVSTQIATPASKAAQTAAEENSALSNAIQKITEQRQGRGNVTGLFDLLTRMGTNPAVLSGSARAINRTTRPLVEGLRMGPTAYHRILELLGRQEQEQEQ